jgi:hypothetical protein
LGELGKRFLEGIVGFDLAFGHFTYVLRKKTKEKKPIAFSFSRGHITHIYTESLSDSSTNINATHNPKVRTIPPKILRMDDE